AVTAFSRLPRPHCISIMAMLLVSPLTFANIATLPRSSELVTIDGLMDEEAWKYATQIKIDTETNPGENIPARVETIAYLLEDGQSLYIAFDARDPDPQAIRAYLQDRDTAWNHDFVGIVLDTYNDERRAFEFFANPLGVQMDLTNDDVNENEDESWDAIWDSAGHINEVGYIVEMEIPLNQLRFPNTGGKQTWGFDLLRFYPRDRRYRFSNNPMDRSVNCYLCQFDKIEGLEGVQPSRDLEIVPTLTGSRTDSTDEPGTTPLQSGDMDAEAGVSIRWGITPDMTANLAINPDFSQVEADVAQLDVNNQFALFFPEKRPFFLEGADYFSTPIDAVFTRTVADPDIGTKLTGKRGNHTYGVFAAQDTATNLLLPGAFGSDSTSLDADNTTIVGRYSRGFGDASSLGALVTSRSGDDYHNSVGGFDLQWKISDQHSIQAQYLHSDTEYPDEVATEFEQPTGSFSGAAIHASYEYESRNWYGWLQHVDRSAGFRADSGFVPQVDINQQLIGGGYTWHGEDDDWWTRMQLRGDWDITHDDSGRMLEREFEAYFGIGGPMQAWYQVGVLSRDTLWDEVLYKEQKISFYTEMQPRGGLLLGVWARYGDQVDFANSRLGDQLRVEPFLDWNISRHLFLKFEATMLQLDTKEGRNVFDAGVYDVRMTWQFNRRSFLRFTTQIQDIDRNPDAYIDEVDANTRRVGRQLLFSYKLNPQTVFFLGYSDNHLDDDDLDRLEETDRTLFLKVGYAWTP
ncbi:MAG: carbohydrate binding family 9 domain-containing protein, partial [Gammaproteobacteria bacterium]|nr:carbohydrate binding family 9 domain-containing protein [Gammaproteobacteria bacterium]